MPNGVASFPDFVFLYLNFQMAVFLAGPSIVRALFFDVVPLRVIANTVLTRRNRRCIALDFVDRSQCGIERLLCSNKREKKVKKGWAERAGVVGCLQATETVLK